MNDSPHTATPAPPQNATMLGLLSALSLLLAAAFAFGTRAPNSDLFMSLAGGRDAAAGKLGQPDDWSFVTQGRIWINQSWLAHRALYGVWKISGETGLLAVRGAMIALLAAGIVLWLRRRGNSAAAACIAAALVLVAARNGLTLRGNLVTLTATPWLLYLLERQRLGSVHWTWLIGVLLAGWTHCHGGFVFGLGVLGLWILTHPPLGGMGDGTSHGRNWLALVGCLVVVGVLPLVAGPFGRQTYTQSFSMASQGEWRTIREWQPLVRSWSDLKIDLQDTPWDVGPLLALAGLLALLGAVAGVRRAVGGRDGTMRADWPGRLFYAGVIGATALMAFSGRRFAPLAALVMSLPLACCLERVWRGWRRASTAAAAVLSVALAAAMYPIFVLGYSGVHPFYPPQRAFERQTMGNNFPVDAVRFMRTHGIAGNVVHEYGVETYLHWVMPEAKVFCGGRAQQIYTETDLTRLRAFQDVRAALLAPSVMQKRNEAYIQRDVNAILYPTASLWPLILALNDSRVWLPVFFDGDQALLIRTVDAAGEPLPQFARFAQGELKESSVAIIDPAMDSDGAKARQAAQSGLIVFPDEASYLYTRALYLTSPWLTAGGGQMTPQRRAAMEEFIYNARRAAIEKATALRPHPRLYELMERLARARPEPRPDTGPYFAEELKRLEAMPVAGADSSDLLRCRIALLDALRRRAEEAGELEEARQFNERARMALDEMTRLARWWQF